MKREVAGAPVLVEAQAPRRAVQENTLVRIFEVVVDDFVYPLISRQFAFVVYELRHAFAVVLVVAGEHVFHGSAPAKYQVPAFFIFCTRGRPRYGRT